MNGKAGTRRGWGRLAGALGLWFLLAYAAGAGEPKGASRPLAQAGPAEAARGLTAFRVEPGFRIELAAAEPLVAAPVALAFDERGRLFVAEMRDYPDLRDQTPHLGRIRLLEDMDEEGSFQTSTIYADNLPWPSAVACYGGGVFVAATPQLLYLKDQRGGGIADVIKTVFTGFGGSSYVPNPGALLNSLEWGLDNRFHCGTAGLGGVVSVLSTAAMPSLALGNDDLAFDPRTLAIEPEAGPAQTGASFEPAGRRFVCGTNHPLQVALWEPRYLARNPFFPAPPELFDAATPATAVWRLVPLSPEARQAPRRPARVQAAPTNALVAGWLTDPRGCVVYRGRAFGSNYLGNVFVADPEGHLIHRFVQRQQGLGVVAERAPNEPRSEFLMSSDPAFRPTCMVNGPEGALYVADLRSGHDTGRIYRIVPADFKRLAPRRLDRMATAELVRVLAGGDGWEADTAGRLLYERQDPAATGLLSNLLCYSRFPLARLRALHALDGLGRLRQEHLLSALQDGDERVRQHAVRLAERLGAWGTVSEGLWGQLRARASDPALRVRYQLAYTLGVFAVPGRDQALADVLARDLDNPWVCAAALSSLGEGAGTFCAQLARDWRFSTVTGQQFLAELAMAIGLRGRMEEVTQVVALAAQSPPRGAPPYGLLTGLAEGLHRTGSALGLVDKPRRLQRFFGVALATAIDDYAPLALRVQAVRFLGVDPSDYAGASDWLRLLLTPREPYALVSAALAARGRCSDPYVASDLIAAGRLLPPALGNEALLALMARSERAGALLAALQSRRLNAAALSPILLNLLRTHRDPAISQQATNLLGPVPRRRTDLVQRFGPALQMRGLAPRGQALFGARCAACHRLGGQGWTLGPDLAGAKVRGRQALLSAILEPNRDVAPEYAACVAETKQGESLLGIKMSQNASTLTLGRLLGGPTVWAMSDLQSVETRSWSLMPEGLEQGLSLQDMADLLEYVLTAPP